MQSFARLAEIVVNGTKNMGRYAADQVKRRESASNR